MRTSPILCPAIAGLLLATPAAAGPTVEDLRREIETLRAEQARAAARIAGLETALQALSPAPAADRPPAPVVAAPSAAAAAAPAAPPRLQVNGDFRLRYESNFGDNDARDRDRAVLRARLRATYAANSWLTLGGQIATGDPDDPNSTDVTLSNFDDDLQVSLDQAYLRANLGKLVIHGGKIPQPFVRTELVWDGDVSPQGVSVAYKAPLPGGAAFKATGLYFLVDESVAGPDSRMVGGQLGFETSASAPWRFELAGSYYAYSLRSLAGGDSGDFRSNRLAGGRYVSDFNLVDVIGAVTYNGFGKAWPVRLVGDYVRNIGAVGGHEDGFGVDLQVGRTAEVGDWRFSYGYAEAETDAVLTAFSHDNTNVASNYLQHTLAVDYVAARNVILNATLHHYRPKKAANAGPNAPNDWLQRLRLNLLVNF